MSAPLWYRRRSHSYPKIVGETPQAEWGVQTNSRGIDQIQGRVVAWTSKQPHTQIKFAAKGNWEETQLAYDIYRQQYVSQIQEKTSWTTRILW